MDSWHHEDWPVPVFVKVIVISLAICGAIVGIISAVVFFLMWIYSMYGENVTAAVAFGSLGFAIVAGIVYMTVEDLW